MAKQTKHKKQLNRWDDSERQGFADGCRRRAKNFGDLRKQESREACKSYRWERYESGEGFRLTPYLLICNTMTGIK